MPHPHYILLLCFLQLCLFISPANAHINNGEPVRTVNYNITTDLSTSHVQTLDKLQEEKIKTEKNSKVIIILSVSIIFIFSILTIVLLKNINHRNKSNKLLSEKNKELQLAKEKSEKAHLVKAEFLSTITHELRTPLYAVTGLTHLLLETNPTEEQKEHLNSLRFSGEYLLSLINNILDLNKLESKKVDVECIPFNLKKRISDVLIALKKPASNQNNILDFSFDPSIPEKIKGDPLKLSQILINLIGNAIKFTRNGEINVRVKKIKNIEDSSLRLLFEVEDNGFGISESQLENIFNNFSQESLEVNRKFGGTGLGLSIVKSLLNLMGSKIRLTSTKNVGSKFFFEINFETVDEIKDAPQENALDKVNLKAMEGKRVLVVEDNKINQLITCKTLQRQKIITEIADNGEIAIKKARSNAYNLILMDIHMPGINGVEASNQIRKFDTTTPIIALTAVTDHTENFQSNGINDIISKPYKPEDFFNALAKAFNGQYS